MSKWCCESYNLILSEKILFLINFLVDNFYYGWESSRLHIILNLWPKKIILFYIYDCWHKTSIRLCWNRKKSKLSMIVGIPNLYGMQRIAWISLTALLEPLPNKEYSTPVQFLWSISLWNCLTPLGLIYSARKKHGFSCMFKSTKTDSTWHELSGFALTLICIPKVSLNPLLVSALLASRFSSFVTELSLWPPVTHFIYQLFSLKFKCFHSYHCT